MNYFDLPDKERIKIIKKACKEAKKMQDKKIKLYNIKTFKKNIKTNIKTFKEALYGEDLTKLNEFLNEEDKGEL